MWLQMPWSSMGYVRDDASDVKSAAVLPEVDGEEELADDRDSVAAL